TIQYHWLRWATGTQSAGTDPMDGAAGLSCGAGCGWTGGAMATGGSAGAAGRSSKTGPLKLGAGRLVTTAEGFCCWQPAASNIATTRGANHLAILGLIGWELVMPGHQIRQRARQP